MSDKKKRSNEISLNSNLFKGHFEWYHCYLKAERIAHVCVVLSENVSESQRGDLRDLAASAAAVPERIVFLAAGEEDPRSVEAAVFAAISKIRLAVTARLIHVDNASIIVGEYEAILERLQRSLHPSPFLTAADFHIPELSGPEHAPDVLPSPLFEQALPPAPHIKDTYKGQSQTPKASNRQEVILAVVLQGNGVSIKDISDVVRDCSEKTIQRELAELVRQGRIKKVGERRWSQYLPA